MSILYLSEQGSYLRRQGGRYVVSKGDEELLSVPRAAVERVVILGNCQVSTQAMGELLASGVEVVYLGLNGSFKGLLEPGYPKNVFVRLAQYERSLDDDYVVDAAAAFVRAKLSGAQRVHRRWRRSGWLAGGPGEHDARLAQAIERLAGCADSTQIRAQEAVAGRAHFALLAAALPPPFEWHGRNRRPPRDPVNALLSLTYMLTLGHVVSACYCHGLDPFIGFLHELDYSRPSLALDLLEPLRTGHCDPFVLRCLQREEFVVADFQTGEERGCRLAPAAFRTFLDLYQQQFARRRPGGGEALGAAVERLAIELATAVRERRRPCLDVAPSEEN